jgi:hypothetical protein
LSVAVDQYDFMFGRGKGLKKEHPEVRHEVARNPVVGIVK